MLPESKISAGVELKEVLKKRSDDDTASMLLRKLVGAGVKNPPAAAEEDEEKKRRKKSKKIPGYERQVQQQVSDYRNGGAEKKVHAFLEVYSRSSLDSLGSQYSADLGARKAVTKGKLEKPEEKSPLTRVKYAGSDFSLPENNSNLLWHGHGRGQGYEKDPHGHGSTHGAHTHADGTVHKGRKHAEKHNDTRAHNDDGPSYGSFKHNHEGGYKHSCGGCQAYAKSAVDRNQVSGSMASGLGFSGGFGNGLSFKMTARTISQSR